MKRLVRGAVGVVSVLASVLAVHLGVASAKTEFQWWHAMQGVLGERVNEIAAKFNVAQSEYEVKAVHKGAYPDTLNAAIACVGGGQAPALRFGGRVAARSCGGDVMVASRRP